MRKNTCRYIYPNTTFYFFNHILPHGINDHEGWVVGVVERWGNKNVLNGFCVGFVVLCLSVDLI